ncbi:septum formation family protein [Nocardioides sp. YIM 152588]|uniref:septum formation family protein n=1 Tax=Nocardioides sp. YIM 152588 TaxID=3158259 RepID=UPI0032E509BC
MRPFRTPFRTAAALAAALALTAGLALAPVTSARAEDEPDTDGPTYGAPAVGECHDYGKKVLLSDNDPTPAVGCKKDHTAYTTAVVYLPDAVEYYEPTWDEFLATMSRKVLPGCAAAARKALETNWRTYMRTAYTWAWFLPTEDEIAHGARWVRCDLVLQAGNDRLQDLPARSPALKRITKAERACIKVANDGSWWETGCTKKHQFKATHNHQLPQGKYPSSKKFQRLGSKHCRGTKKYWWWVGSYRSEWRAGNRVIQCYALDR